MLDWGLENETGIRQSMIADNLGKNADPTEQVDGYAQGAVQLQNRSGTSQKKQNLVDRAEMWTRVS